MNSKIYRCGWCGCPTTETGTFPGEKIFERVYNIIKKYGDSHTQKVNGDCCAHEFMEPERMRVTRDMAIDAGDPDLEGELI